MSETVAITGANGNLGLRLVKHLGESTVRAIVRSERAKQSLIKQFSNLDVRVVDYTNEIDLRAALEGCTRVVHLVGILKETKYSSYFDAHEQSCRTLVDSLTDSIKQVVYLSILGSQPDQANTCLASKGAAEEILLSSKVNVAILQVPMVLGEGDYASAALRRNALKGRVMAFRASSLEQPIYAGDVVEAINATFKLNESQRFLLAGPESLTRAALIQRAADIHHKAVSIVSIPVAIGMALAWVFEWLPNPPVTRAMLGVLDHDDATNSDTAVASLGITLTSLDDMLRHTIS